MPAVCSAVSVDRLWTEPLRVSLEMAIFIAKRIIIGKFLIENQTINSGLFDIDDSSSDENQSIKSVK